MERLGPLELRGEVLAGTGSTDLLSARVPEGECWEVLAVLGYGATAAGTLSLLLYKESDLVASTLTYSYVDGKGDNSFRPLVADARAEITLRGVTLTAGSLYRCLLSGWRWRKE